MYLRCYTQQNPRDWYKLLPWASYWYNTEFQSVIRMTPYKAVFGKDPPQVIKYSASPSNTPLVQQQLLECDDLIAQLKLNLARA